MDRKYVCLIVGIMTVAVAVMSFNSYLSVTSASGAAVLGGATGSLAVAMVSLVIACALFAKHFGLIK